MVELGVTNTSLNNHAVANPFRYRGYYYDTETGLYYLQSRYYNPEWGRFISSDTTDVLDAETSLPGNVNLFAYAGNNPIMNIDPTGVASVKIHWWGIRIELTNYETNLLLNGIKFYITGMFYLGKYIPIPFLNEFCQTIAHKKRSQIKKANKGRGIAIEVSYCFTGFIIAGQYWIPIMFASIRSR